LKLGRVKKEKKTQGFRKTGKEGWWRQQGVGTVGGPLAGYLTLRQGKIIDLGAVKETRKNERDRDRAQTRRRPKASKVVRAGARDSFEVDREGRSQGGRGGKKMTPFHQSQGHRDLEQCRGRPGGTKLFAGREKGVVWGRGN